MDVLVKHQVIQCDWNVEEKEGQKDKKWTERGYEGSCRLGASVRFQVPITEFTLPSASRKGFNAGV